MHGQSYTLPRAVIISDPSDPWQLIGVLYSDHDVMRRSPKRPMMVDMEIYVMKIEKRKSSTAKASGYLRSPKSDAVAQVAREPHSLTSLLKVL